MKKLLFILVSFILPIQCMEVSKYNFLTRHPWMNSKIQELMSDERVGRAVRNESKKVLNVGKKASFQVLKGVQWGVSKTCECIWEHPVKCTLVGATVGGLGYIYWKLPKTYQVNALFNEVTDTHANSLTSLKESGVQHMQDGLVPLGDDMDKAKTNLEDQESLLELCKSGLHGIKAQQDDCSNKLIELKDLNEFETAKQLTEVEKIYKKLEANHLELNRLKEELEVYESSKETQEVMLQEIDEAMRQNENIIYEYRTLVEETAGLKDAIKENYTLMLALFCEQSSDGNENKGK